MVVSHAFLSVGSMWVILDALLSSVIVSPHVLTSKFSPWIFFFLHTTAYKNCGCDFLALNYNNENSGHCKVHISTACCILKTLFNIVEERFKKKLNLDVCVV